MKEVDHSVAIVGANGQVGTELSILLREAGYTVYPIVRNHLGSAFFEHHDFAYRIGEITDDTDAPKLLSNAETIIVAAFAPWFGGPQPKEARQINETIVRNSIDYAPENATIVYFSSLVAYGAEIGLSNLHWYGRSKRRLESIVAKSCEKTNKTGYALRLGHVYGPSQDHTRTFIGNLEKRERVYLPVKPTAKTNIVHTVTLAAAIEQCIKHGQEPGTYGVVNSPQWTWRDVVDHYLPETAVQFRPELSTDDKEVRSSPTKDGVARLLRGVEKHRESLMSLLPYLPDRFSTYLDHTLSSSDASDAIRRYNDRLTYSHRHFQYQPVPAPLVEVPPTHEKLENETVIRDILSLSHNQYKSR